jgi:hypothetical protein
MERPQGYNSNPALQRSPGVSVTSVLRLFWPRAYKRSTGRNRSEGRQRRNKGGKESVPICVICGLKNPLAYPDVQWYTGGTRENWNALS